jgi:hypothetical protein
MFCLLARKLLVPGISAPRLALLLQKMLITATTAVTFLVFAVSNAISLALMGLVGAVLATLIGWASVDK